MKIAFALILLATQAHAAPLLRAERQPGFEAQPQSQVFELDSSGAMKLTVRDFRSGKTTVQNLGKLPADTLSRLTGNVNSINAEAPLVDLNGGSPLCTDAPSYSFSIFLKGEEKEIGRIASCHVWEVSGPDAAVLIGFEKGYLN